MTSYNRFFVVLVCGLSVLLVTVWLAIAPNAVLSQGATTQTDVAPGAKDVVWNISQEGTLWGNTCRGDSGQPRLFNPNITVSYHTQVTNADTGEAIACGTTVPKGTRVEYTFVPHEEEDIYWFITGAYEDSPYGMWIAGAERPGTSICTDPYRIPVNREKKWGRLYALLSVNPPAKSLTGAGDMGCTQSGSSYTCTTPTEGSFDPAFQFAQTQGTFYLDHSGSWCRTYNNAPACTVDSPYPTYFIGNGGSEPTSEGGRTFLGSNNEGTEQNPYVLTVPAQTVSCAITVSDTATTTPATTPSAPTLSSGGACVVGQAHTITFVSSDAQGRQIRYAIDWNADGALDEYKPASGYVPSGTSQNATHAYAIAGLKTVRVRAENDQGVSSGWSTLSFSCTDTSDENCPAGQVRLGNQCVAACPAGQHAVGNFCICDDINAPPDAAGQCMTQVCPSGFQWDTGSGQCVAVQQCALAPICSDQTHALNQCTGQTADCGAYGQGWHCSNGACNPPAPPVASIAAVPSLVSVGSASNIAWTSQITSTCAVTGSNGDGGQGWDGTTGSHTSSPVHSQTIYTLVCQGLNGTSITRTVTINIIPGEEEPCSPGFHHENGVCVPN